jgi:hypothetical protein
MEQAEQQKAIMDSPWMKCECGSIMFSEVVLIKRLSAELTGEPRDTVMNVPQYKCDECGKLPEFGTKHFDNSDFPIPDELKAKPLITE